MSLFGPGLFRPNPAYVPGGPESPYIPVEPEQPNMRPNPAWVPGGPEPILIPDDRPRILQPAIEPVYPVYNGPLIDDYDGRGNLTGFSSEDYAKRAALVKNAVVLGLRDQTILEWWLQRPIVGGMRNELQKEQRASPIDISYTDREVYENNNRFYLGEAIEGLEALVINKRILRPEPDNAICEAMDRWGVPPVKELVENYTVNRDTDTVCTNLTGRRLQYLLKLANYIMFGATPWPTREDVNPKFLAAVRDLTTPLFRVGEYPYLSPVTFGDYTINARVSRNEFLESREDYLKAQALFDEWVEKIKKPKPSDELPPEPEGPSEPGPIGPGGLPPGYAEDAYTAPMFEPRKVLLRSITKTGGLTIVAPASLPWNSKYDYLWNMWR